MIYGIAGMIAMIAAFWADETYTYGDGPWLIAVSMAPGALLGLASAYAVPMTGLPEMVGAYNGFGGLAAAVTGYGLYLDPSATLLVRNGGEVRVEQTDAMLWVQALALVLSVVIGTMTFTGSCVAVGKLHGTIASRPRIVPFRVAFTLVSAALVAVFGSLAFAEGGWNDRGEGIAYLALVGVLSGAYGAVAVMAIGGGDMPVSISFLNSLSGFSTSAAGLMLSNTALVVSGAFVGCSGLILTLVMCRAMNRSVRNVLMGGFGSGSSSSKKVDNARRGREEDQGVVREMSAEVVVQKLVAAKSVIVVPGYGMVRALPNFCSTYSHRPTLTTAQSCSCRLSRKPSTQLRN